MSTTTTHPVDPQLIGIIHDALRCELGRAFDTLSTPAPLDAHRRAALADRLTWTLAFLERHHSTERAFLWAPARQRSPSAVPLIRQLTTGHARIRHAADAVAHASSFRLPDTPQVRDDLRGALERLCTILLPHLDREEAELGPILASTITDAEWSTWHNRLFHTTRPSEFARENHWLNDTRTVHETAHHAIRMAPFFNLLSARRLRSHFARHEKEVTHIHTSRPTVAFASTATSPT